MTFLLIVRSVFLSGSSFSVAILGEEEEDKKEKKTKERKKINCMEEELQ